MRITFILAVFDVSGGVRVISELAQRLKERGHDVVVARPPRPVPFKSRMKSLLSGRGWPRRAARGPSHFDDKDVLRRTLAEWRPITETDVPDADMVVATWWETAEWVARFSPAKGAKAFFIQHYEVFGSIPAERVDAVWRLPLRKITIAGWLVDLARDRFDDDDVSLVPISYDRTVFHAEPRGKQPAPTIGILYSSAPLKGCDVSLRVVAEAAERFPGLRVLSFGATGPDPTLPLPPYASYLRLPPQDQIRALYSQCDVWLCGSRAEGFVMPPLEAMACRCPVVSTRVGGPTDYVDDGVNGFLVDVGDEEGLADRVVRVLSLAEPEWRAMSDAAHRTAERFNWDDATTHFESALRAAVDGSTKVARLRLGEMPIHESGGTRPPQPPRPQANGRAGL